MYLPQEVCQAFADTFGLTWNPTFSLYLVDEVTHRNMTSNNPNITLTLGDALAGGPTIDIVLPYASFQLDAVFPRVPETMQYFPLQPGNDSQYTLGRVFLQEA